MEKYFKRKTPSSSTSDHVTKDAAKKKPNDPIDVIDLNDLPWDPVDRPRISQYNVNQRDDIRQKYWNRGPCQPRGHDFKRTIIGNKSRRFVPSWFNIYGHWLEYSVKAEKAFCLCCYLFRDDFGHQGGNEAFVTEGFNGWNKTERLASHVGDFKSFHNRALKKCEDLMKQKQSISFAFNKQTEQERNDYRIRLHVSVTATRYCLNGELPFRGHDESDTSLYLGNFPLERHGVTHMCGAPVVLNMLSNVSGAKGLKSPVKIMTAGAPPPAAVLARAEAIGFVVSHGYGLTETGGLVVTCAWKGMWDRLPATERARLKSRQGVRTVGFTDMDVVDPESGLSVNRDGMTLGEVVLRGGCVMLGYLKDPEGTAKCMRENGWFYTGDVAVMHPDGYLEIKDRSKDVIISGGENLSSVEVESVLYTHHAVNEAAVVARADEFWGETPCAFVSLKAEMVGKVTEKEVMEYCRGKMPGYMVPKTVVFKEELPKTSTGKIQKFVLREMAKSMGPLKKSRM